MNSCSKASAWRQAVDILAKAGELQLQTSIASYNTATRQQAGLICFGS